MIGRIVLLSMVGTAGAVLGHRTKMPGGILIGAMLTTALWSLAAPDSQPLPDGFRSVGLVLLGIHIGSLLDRRVLARIRRVLPVAAGTILVLIAVSAGLGWALYSWSGEGISAVTVVLGIMPGGASGLGAIAYDLGAEAPLVTSMHTVRMIIVLGALPLVLRWLAGLGRGTHSD